VVGRSVRNDCFRQGVHRLDPANLRPAAGADDFRALRARPRGHNPADLLETATGTGVVTGALASLLPDTRIVATDLNEPMLAQAKARLADHHQITWQQADALALPFDDERFDIVVCQFGVMFFPDRVEGYSEARRVLKPGGRFFFNV
jgi:ubiquinone/menaquinone biosynthesis C-methylase UbiE